MPRKKREDTMLTTPEAAARLGVSENTLRNWSDQGRVPAIRRPGGGGYRRYDPTVIERVRREMGLPDSESEN
jgi:excisionase family DNA binding protein